MTLFRGSGGDLPLMPWLEERIWPVEAKLDAEDVYWGARLACAGDDPQRHHPLLGHVLAPGGDRAGGRRRRHPGDDRGAALRRRRQPRGAARDGATAASRRSPSFGPLIAPALAPHAIYTVSEESLRWIGELSAERELPVQIHLSETEQEVAGLPRRARRAARRLPRPPRAAERAHRARPRRLARPRGAGAGRRARRHRRHQPGREHEARGRRRLPLPGGARGRASRSASAPTAPAPTTRSTCSPT